MRNSKKARLAIVICFTLALFVYWAILAVTHTKLELINYWWEAALAFEFFLFGVFGLQIAKKWSWLKSSMGGGVLLISLGLIVWAIGQAGWTYAVIKNPSQQNPPSQILSVIYYTSIPLWFIGTLRLSKATGAKYGLRGAWAKIGLLLLILIMFLLSYYLLVDVARGGASYFHNNTFLNELFDLGYAAGDAINLTLALAIFGLSWKYLGGHFKVPILLILLAFASIYLSDLMYSYYDGKGQYYNGQWTDILYLATGAIFGCGVVLLDPIMNRISSASQTVKANAPVVGQTGLQASIPESDGKRTP